MAYVQGGRQCCVVEFLSNMITFSFLGFSSRSFFLQVIGPMFLTFQEEFWVDPGRSIPKAYQKTDQEILSQKSDIARGGSTAVTAILINGRRLWIANLGDSRAVLSRGGQALQMTVDHEPNTDRATIEGKGGFVSNMPGWVLQLHFYPHIFCHYMWHSTIMGIIILNH